MSDDQRLLHEHLLSIERHISTRYSNPAPTAPKYDLTAVAVGPVLVVSGRHGSFNSTGRMITSNDGIVWIAPDDPTNVSGNYAYGVLWNDSKWLLGADYAILHSVDGIDWTSTASALPDYSEGVGFGAGLYIAVGQQGRNTDVLATSPDGVNWTLRNTPFTNGYAGHVDWNGSLFVATGWNPGRAYTAMTSSDGITWYAQHTPFDGNTSHTVRWVEPLGLWILTGRTNAGGGRALATSPDGITWTARITGIGFGGGQVAYSPSLGLLVYHPGNTDAFTPGNVYLSTNGTSWTYNSGGSGMDAGGGGYITWSESLGLFIATNYNGGVWTSPNGTTWTHQSIPSGFYAYGVGARS